MVRLFFEVSKPMFPYSIKVFSSFPKSQIPWEAFCVVFVVLCLLALREGGYFLEEIYCYDGRSLIWNYSRLATAPKIARSIMK